MKKEKTANECKDTQDCEIPYVIEFALDTTAGYNRIKPTEAPSRLKRFLLGMLWAVVLASLLYVVGCCTC